MSWKYTHEMCATKCDENGMKIYTWDAQRNVTTYDENVMKIYTRDVSNEMKRKCDKNIHCTKLTICLY